MRHAVHFETLSQSRMLSSPLDVKWLLKHIFPRLRFAQIDPYRRRSIRAKHWSDGKLQSPGQILLFDSAVEHKKNSAKEGLGDKQARIITANWRWLYSSQWTLIKQFSLRLLTSSVNSSRFLTAQTYVLRKQTAVQLSWVQSMINRASHAVNRVFDPFNRIWTGEGVPRG